MCNFLPVKTKEIDTDENEIVETMNSFLFNSKHIEVKPCGVCFEKLSHFFLATLFSLPHEMPLMTNVSIFPLERHFDKNEKQNANFHLI